MENTYDEYLNGLIYAEDPGNGSWFEIKGSNGELTKGDK